MADLRVHMFPCLSDNYGALVHDPDTGLTAAIDAPEADTVRQAVTETGWNLTDIFVTHHHPDHTQGIGALKKSYGAYVRGPEREVARIEGLDETVAGGTTFEWAGRELAVIDTPGHTLGQVAYHIPADSLLFAADALFAMGCGRIFEGTPEMMWQTMQRLMALPDDTIVYAGHEYTMANALFAVSVDPSNRRLTERLSEVKRMRERNEPTLPTTIGLEKATNPFLRAADPDLRRSIGMENASDLEVFTEVRARKDRA